LTDGIHTTLTSNGHPDFCVQSSLMLMLPIFNFAKAYTNDPSVPAGRVIGVTGMHVTGPPDCFTYF